MTSVLSKLVARQGARVRMVPACADTTRRLLSSYYQEARNVKMGETRSMNGIDATVRNDWTKEEINEVYNMPMLELLYRASSVHRMFFDPTEVQQCTLLSIKTGGCTEDCGYCSQSVRHKTFVKPTPQMKIDEVIEAAKRAKEAGSTRFCMGAAWRELGNKKKAFNNILDMVREVNGMGMEVCCTLGMLNGEQARQLKEAGLTAYNHNLDTSREFYPSVITTRSYEDRLETISNVREAGISVCCGGILGLGEAENDRVGLLHTLATLEEHPESVPINALVPVDGTPLADEGKADAPDIWDMGRMIATARVVMPRTMVRLSAGRLSFSEAEQAMMFMAGANSIFTGDRLLTTSNPEFDSDKALFAKPPSGLTLLAALLTVSCPTVLSFIRAMEQNKDVALNEATQVATAADGEDRSTIEPGAVGAKTTAATVEQSVKISVTLSETGVPSEAPAGVGTDTGAFAASEALEPVAAVDGMAATPVEKKRKDGVAPETTAAEKVLTLLEIGLVDKEEMAAYYEALSELERTTREAKEAAAAPVNPAKPSSTAPSTAEDGPLSLVPFPLICGALGASGTHALHLTGDLGTAVSVFGAVAGATLGALVVAGDDAGGRAARAAGSVVARSAGTAGGVVSNAVGKGISESVGGVAGAATSAVEEVVVKAPANLAAGLASSTSNAVSSAVGSVASLPGQLAAKAVDGAKGALQDTSEVVARKASEAAAGALQSTSEAALDVMKDTPKEAAELVKELVAGPGQNLAAFVTRASEKAEKREERQRVQPKSVPSASARQQSTVAAPREQDTLEREGVPAEELEAKLLSVRKALERFDDVKNRIQEAHTSDTFKKTVGMTRSMDMAAEREKGEQARAAAQRGKDMRDESKETPRSRSPPSAASKLAASTTTLKLTDQDRRKQVAERLLEKASQRATEAKTGLKAAAESARRESDLTVATATGAEQKPRQEAFIAVLLALYAMCASAFVVPSAVKSGSFATPAVRATSTVAPKATMNMGLEQIADVLPAVPAEAHNAVLEIANNPLLLSLRADSFGGLIGPIGGCLAVATFIVVMAPPRVD
eukprot:g10531.t2